MVSSSLCYLFHIIILFSCSSTVNAQNTSFIIPLNKTLTLKNKELYGDFYTIKSNSTLKFDLENINKKVYFIIFQVHSHIYNITLYNNTKVHGSYITGTNVGLYSSMDPFLDTFYVVNENDLDLKLYVSVHGYGRIDPIPGGCNMEFPLNISTFMRIKYNRDYIFVDAGAPKGYGDDCKGLSPKANISFYMMYLEERNYGEESYFEGIRNMITMEKIEEYGEKIPMTSQYWLVRRMLSAYPGIGSIYVAVAERDINKGNPYYSIYVPTYTYACTPDEDGCQEIDDVISQLFCALLFFIGLFTCFFGHRFFKTEMFLVGTFAGVILTNITIALNSNLDRPALLGASVLSGVFFGAIWLLFWWFYGIPVFAVILPTLSLGFICSAIIYYRVPGGHPLLINDVSFWIFFITITLLTSLVMVSTAFLSNILCCAVLGAYATVFSMDHYIGSNLKYIIINTLRRAVVDKFNYAILSPPFQWRDIIATLLWVALATSGFLFQHYDNRGRPPFPPPPRSISSRMPEFHDATTHRRRRYGAIDTGADTTVPVAYAPAVVQNERTPLMENQE